MNMLSPSLSAASQTASHLRIAHRTSANGLRDNDEEVSATEGVTRCLDILAGQLNCQPSTITHLLKSRMRRRRKSRSTATNFTAADYPALSVTATLSGAYSTWYGSWRRPTPPC